MILRSSSVGARPYSLTSYASMYFGTGREGYCSFQSVAKRAASRIFLAAQYFMM